MKYELTWKTREPDYDNKTFNVYSSEQFDDIKVALAKYWSIYLEPDVYSVRLTRVLLKDSK